MSTGSPLTADPGTGAVSAPQQPDRAWVVFTDGGRQAGARHAGARQVRERPWHLWWLALLKPGFRHCFALLGGGGHWVIVDPTAAMTDVGVWPHDSAPDLPDRLAAAGFNILPAPLHRGETRPAPWAPFTCVEAVKRLIGLRAPWVLTPWGLHRHLSRNTFI